MIRTVMSLGFSSLQVAEFLDRSKFQIRNRNKILTEDVDKKKTKLDKQQKVFGTKVKNIFAEHGFKLEGVDQSIEIPGELVDKVQELMSEDPNLENGTRKKKRGRPPRELEDSEVDRELKKLMSIAFIIKDRRPRKDSYPGDGRQNGLIQFALYRLLAADFDPNKLPDADAPVEELMTAGIKKRDSETYRELKRLIDEFPVEQMQQEVRNYMSDPPPESFLPPTLHTLTGLRGLLLYNERILTPQTDAEMPEAEQVAEQPEEGAVAEEMEMVENSAEQVADQSEEGAVGRDVDLKKSVEEEAHLRFYRLLQSLFYYPMMLVQQQQRNPNPE